MSLFETFINNVFPPVCGICGKICADNLCDKCYNNISILQNNKINYYNKNLSKLYYLFKYDGIIREKIIDYKFNNKSYLYKTFAEILVRNDTVKEMLNCSDIILSVPIHKKRKLERGYNQCELITKEISEIMKIETDNKIIVKQINNKVQSTLNKLERLENVKNVYKIVNNEKIINKKVIIFDDIYTTGSTVNEISGILREVGVKSVSIITIAKD